MISDPIGDMLTSIRNGYAARLKTVKVPTSKLKTALAQVLKGEGYVVDFSAVDDRTLEVKLRYVSVPNSLSKQPVLTGISRISKPGLRVYKDSGRMPRILGGLGTVIVSTSKGLMTAKEAKKQNVGGEVVCKVW
jgi:small subunit ribosomal protein S8